MLYFYTWFELIFPFCVFLGVLYCLACALAVCICPGGRAVHQVPDSRCSSGGDPGGRTTTRTAEEVQRRE